MPQRIRLFGGYALPQTPSIPTSVSERLRTRLNLQTAVEIVCEAHADGRPVAAEDFLRRGFPADWLRSNAEVVAERATRLAGKRGLSEIWFDERQVAAPAQKRLSRQGSSASNSCGGTPEG